MLLIKQWIKAVLPHDTENLSTKLYTGIFTKCCKFNTGCDQTNKLYQVKRHRDLLVDWFTLHKMLCSNSFLCLPYSTVVKQLFYPGINKIVWLPATVTLSRPVKQLLPISWCRPPTLFNSNHFCHSVSQVNKWKKGKIFIFLALI